MGILQPGDIVDVIAPASKCRPPELLQGLKQLKQWGLVPRVAKPLFGPDPFCAASDTRRFQQLKQALQSRDGRAIWCVRGGYGSTRLLPQLIKLRPPQQSKLLIGFSDISALHHVVNQHWGWSSLHAAVLSGFAKDLVDSGSLKLIAKLLFQDPSHRYRIKALKPGQSKLSGPVVGGNLVVLESLLGTTSFKGFTGGILVLEDIGERAYAVERSLIHLQQAGAFKGIKALVFGSFTGGAEPDGKPLHSKVFKRFAETATFPVFAGLKIGHAPGSLPIFFNTRAEISQEGGQWRLQVEGP